MAHTATRDRKVVYGSCSAGFTDMTGPLTHTECIAYIRRHSDRLAPMSADAHYAPGLDIMDVETGRLMSWVL